jgi:hypothetical protein
VAHDEELEGVLSKELYPELLSLALRHPSYDSQGRNDFE